MNEKFSRPSHDEGDSLALGSPGEDFLRRVRRSAVHVLGDSTTGREVLELCEAHEEARRLVLEDRSSGHVVVAVVGATGQGKSWLIQQLVRSSPVAKSIVSGNNGDEATEKLTWIGPSPPADLDSIPWHSLPGPSGHQIETCFQRNSIPMPGSIAMFARINERASHSDANGYTKS